MKNRSLNIALIGNPNTGKSTLFNSLTGLRQKVGNYPGITVERKIGTLTIDGTQHTLIDLPGTYSLNHKKADERIAYQTLIGEYEHERSPDLVVVVLDSTNLDRNLYLVTQVMDLEIPTLVLLNMSDLAEEQGITPDTDRMQQMLGVPVLSVVAKNKGDMQRVKQAIGNHSMAPSNPLQWQPNKPLSQAVSLITDKWLKPHTNVPERAHPIEALRLISDNQVPEDFEAHPDSAVAKEIIANAKQQIEGEGHNPAAAEVMARYDFIERCTGGQSAESLANDEDTLSDKIDAVVTHKFAGPVLFVAILLLMFQAIFSWAEPFMGMIDLLFVQTGQLVAESMPPGVLNDLLVEGVIAGLGGVVIFLPQIMFLFFFISILEGTGYMARAAFVMDGFMTRIGLHGRSVVPLISGFACAVPGIMATRSIESWSDRLITIMVLPFMACSARLPVYALMISAFVPQETVFGFIGLQGLTFFGLYIFGIVMAIAAAWVMKLFYANSDSTPFMMELPAYKIPNWSAVFYNMFERGWLFIKEAGRVIIAISIVLWFLASYPQVDVPASIENKTQAQIEASGGQTAASYRLEKSYAGQIGHFIEPVIAPLGFDWKIGIGLITSFAAREVMVGTLNTIYSVGESGDNVKTLEEKIVNDRNPETGEPVFSTLSAISLMVFFALAMQCMSTLAIVRRETNSWKWPIVMFSYMSILAYICSLAVYQGGLIMGY